MTTGFGTQRATRDKANLLKRDFSYPATPPRHNTAPAPSSHYIPITAVPNTMSVLHLAYGGVKYGENFRPSTEGISII